MPRHAGGAARVRARADGSVLSVSLNKSFFRGGVVLACFGMELGVEREREGVAC